MVRSPARTYKAAVGLRLQGLCKQLPETRHSRRPLTITSPLRQKEWEAKPVQR